MVQLQVNACASCVHRQRSGPNATIFCEAFPNGVPPDIVMGYNPHTGPAPGDGGIHWELRPDRELQHQQYLARRRTEGLDAGTNP